jgi:hypothetical protein
MTYDTEMEMQAINIIKKHFPDYKIINPKLQKYQEECRQLMGDKHDPGEEIGYFLDLTEPCEIGCFLQYYSGDWSAGSATEVNHMYGGGKKVFLIDLESESLKPVTKTVKSLSFDETYKRLAKAGRSGDGTLKTDRL